MDYTTLLKLVIASPELLGDFIVLLQAIQVFMAKVKAAEVGTPTA
jgi:hypothetical protein